MKKWYCVLTRRPICSLVLVGLLPFPLDRATRLAWSMATNEQSLCICLPLLILARERSTLERRCASGRKSSLPCSPNWIGRFHLPFVASFWSSITRVCIKASRFRHGSRLTPALSVGFCLSTAPG